MKKLLFISFLLLSAVLFAQQIAPQENNMTGQKKQTTLFSVSAYPNPLIFDTTINFDSNENQMVEFTVKNLLGKIVFLQQIDAKKGNNSILFEKGNLTKGMYIYSLQTESEIVSKRLVIK